MLTVEMKEGRGRNRWNDGGSKVQEEVLSGTSETGCEEHMGAIKGGEHEGCRFERSKDKKKGRLKSKRRTKR